MISTKYLFRKFLVTFGAACLLLSTAIQSYAVEKVGTTSMQVLKIPLGVRGIGLGNSLCADARDVEAVWWNPGALTEITKKQVSVSQINLPADIHLNSVAFGTPWGSYSAISLHVINLYTEDMPVRTWERPQGTGENFNAYDFVAGASYARKLTDRFSLGANLRYLRSGLENETYDGVSLDFGTLYKTSLRSLRLAMAIQNLGPDVKYSGTYKDYRNISRNDGELLDASYEGASLPTIFRLGIAFDAFEMLKINHPKEHSVMVTAEMNHPNDNRERLNVGGEYGYNNILFLRLGGKFGYDEEGFAAGFGVRIPVLNDYVIKADYAYSDQGRITEASSGFMDQPHRFAVEFEW